jgi:hypothetical protein
MCGLSTVTGVPNFVVPPLLQKSDANVSQVPNAVVISLLLHQESVILLISLKKSSATNS